MKKIRASGVGIDIDGTITALPELFRKMSKSLTDLGIPVHIVTSRSSVGREDTLRELRSYGIYFSDLYFLPPIATAQTACPHHNLNWFQRFQWQKVGYATSRELSVFIDDDEGVLSLFRSYAPGVLAITPEVAKQHQFSFEKTAMKGSN